MNPAFLLRWLTFLSLLLAYTILAGPLTEKHRADPASAVAGSLTARIVLRPFNPATPFISHYVGQYASEGSIRTPVSPAQMGLLKSRLIWEYGPLSAKALGHVEHLNDAVLAIARENPGLLENPAELANEIIRKIRNLESRRTFHGTLAEVQEARFFWVGI